VRSRITGIAKCELSAYRVAWSHALTELALKNLSRVLDSSAIRPGISELLLGKGGPPMPRHRALALLDDEVGRLEALKAGIELVRRAAAHDVDFVKYTESHGGDTVRAMEGDDTADPRLEKLKDEAIERLAKEKREKVRLEREKDKGPATKKSRGSGHRGGPKRRRWAWANNARSLAGDASQGQPDFSRPPPSNPPPTTTAAGPSLPYCFNCYAKGHYANQCPHPPRQIAGRGRGRGRGGYH